MFVNRNIGSFMASAHANDSGCSRLARPTPGSATPATFRPGQPTRIPQPGGREQHRKNADPEPNGMRERQQVITVPRQKKKRPDYRDAHGMFVAASA